MFLRNCWYVAAEAAEVGRKPLGRVLLNEPVMLYRKEDGTAVALEDRCCHRRAPLHLGKLVGDDVQCGYHGFVFNSAGACIKVPGHDHLPFKNAGVRSYPVCEMHKFLWVWMGEAAKADPALIPDFHHNDDPAWGSVGACIHSAADYQLFNDNLVDLSHVGFVHSATIGSDDTNAELKFERGDNVLRIVRTAKGIDTPPHMRHLGLGKRADMTKVITFAPASNITILVTWAAHPEPGQPARTVNMMIINAITPERDGTCHYFWAAARDFEVGNPRIDDFMHAEVMKAFNEDKVILEAQQKVIDLDPAAPIISVHGDWGGVQARRLMERLIAEEAAPQGVAAQ